MFTMWDFNYFHDFECFQQQKANWIFPLAFRLLLNKSLWRTKGYLDVFLRKIMFTNEHNPFLKTHLGKTRAVEVQQC